MIEEKYMPWWGWLIIALLSLTLIGLAAWIIWFLIGLGRSLG